MAKSLIVLLLSVASTFASNYSHVQVQGKTVRSYYNGEMIQVESSSDCERCRNLHGMDGLSAITYNHVDGLYYFFSDSDVLEFDLIIDEDDTVDVSASYGRPVSSFWSDAAFIDRPNATDRPGFMMVADRGLFWIEFTYDTERSKEDIPDNQWQLGHPVRPHGERNVTVGGIASLYGADMQYVVYSEQTDYECVRIVVNSANATGKDLSYLYSLNYEIDIAGREGNGDKVGIVDITLFEDDNQVLYGLILEENEEVYLVQLSGDVEEFQTDQSCDSELLSNSTSPAIPKRALFSFNTGFPGATLVNSLSFHSLSIMFRGPKEEPGLINEDNKMLLVAANDNTGTQDKNNMVFFTLDTSDLNLNLTPVAHYDRSTAPPHRVVFVFSYIMLFIFTFCKFL